MPRNAEDTRDLLIHAGRRLFARDGVYRVSLRSIVHEAGQRNESALHYHFGSRQGLLDAIIAVYNDRIEDERRHVLSELDERAERPSLDELVAALVVPYSRTLLDAGGREFLQIIAQMSNTFDAWDREQAVPEQASITFHAIADVLGRLRPDLTPELRHQRVTTFLDLVTHALAARARRVDEGRGPLPPHDAFVADLIDVCVGALAGPGPAAQAGNTSDGSSGSNSSVGRARE